jgi:FixJ family two-component response regulator
MGHSGGRLDHSSENAPRHKPSVFVIDDDKPLLDSLLALLAVLELPVRTFNCPSSFLQVYRPEMPGCLVLDVRLPRQNGIQMYEQLVHEGKRLPAIFITADADVSTAVAAMKSGAIEFLEKPFDGQKLLECVRRALALDAEWRRRDATYAAIADRIRHLSDRELETLELIRAGESNKSMAAKLLLTERAVEMRRSRMMQKLQVRSVAELLELATTYDILTELRTAPAASWKAPHAAT